MSEKPGNKEDLLAENQQFRLRIVELEKGEATRKKVEAELLESNMRLSKALTELKRRQQQIIQQARLNALGQMTSGIAHDFNNALMPIQGLSEFLLNNPDAMKNGEDLKSILRDINEAAKHATELVRRLSNFYRSTEESEHSLVDISDVVDATIALTRPRWKEEMASRGVIIDIRKELDKMPPLVCSEAQIREMLTNLILNAVDAMPQGGSITIRSYRENKWLVFRVSDTGIGMSPEIKARCFEPFFTTKGLQGTGIGLSMVYGIVRGHGGDIFVESEEGRGTTFTIRFPADVPLPKRDRSQPKSEGVGSRPLRVLIVDDELWSLNLMVRFFENNQHVVTVAQTGRDGINKFQQDLFDLVVTDRALPDMSGDTVADEVKHISPEVPVIMVTGFGEIMKATGEKPEGVDEILSKPITRGELAEAVNRILH